MSEPIGIVEVPGRLRADGRVDEKAWAKLVEAFNTPIRPPMSFWESVLVYFGLREDRRLTYRPLRPPILSEGVHVELLAGTDSWMRWEWPSAPEIGRGD